MTREEKCRILYCACGSFIPIDVQDMQHTKVKKCILCCVKEAIVLMDALKGDGK